MLTRRILVLVLLLLFASSTLSLVFAQSSAAPNDVTNLRINEFMALNQNNLEDPDEPGTHPDWIEIYNGGGTAVNLQNLYLSDDPTNLTKSPITATIMVPANDFVLFYADSQPEQGPHHTNFGLSGNGENILLVGNDGSTIIDSYTFGPQTADIAEGRFPDGADNWQPMTAPSPGSSNAIAPIIEDVVQTPANPSSSDSVTVNARITDDGTVEFATLYYSATQTSFTAVPMSALANNRYEGTIPAFPTNTTVDYYIEAGDDMGQSSVHPSDGYSRYVVGFVPPTLYINEFVALNTTLPDPDEPGTFPDWIEIYNPGGTAVDLDGYYLTDNLTNLVKSPINGSVIVPAGGFVLFYADSQPEQGANHTNFALSSTNGEDVALVGPDGSTIIDSHTFGPQTADISEGRSPDGADNWIFFNPPTPGSSNTQPPHISNTSHAPQQPSSADSVTVTTTVTDDGSVTVTLFTVINGNSGSAAMSPLGNNQFSASIPAQTDGTIVQYYVRAVDNDNQTSNDPPGAPTDTYTYIVGYTAPPLFINEFMASNSSTLTDPVEPTEFPDWIEIYNAGGTAVNLNGYYFSDDPANLTKSPITQTLTVPANGFLLVYADSDPFQGPEHTNFGLSTNGESVLLVAPDGTTIVDSYTFGPQTADVSEGRLPDGGNDWVFFNVPTPGSSNAFTPPNISSTSFAPTQPGDSDPVTVTSQISDDGQVVAATLFYRTGGTFSALPMTAQGNGSYSGTIPAFAAGTTVEFYVTAQDNDGLISSDPPTAPNATYSYTVGTTLPTLIINEFMADNGSTLEDPDESGEFPDWIEIYNAGETAVDLNGFYLSDDLASPTKSPITQTLTIPAGSYLLIYADGDPFQGAAHADFKLGAGGESVLLVYSDGTTVLDSRTFGAQTTDVSEGRCPNVTGNWQTMSAPTPGAANVCTVNYTVYLPLIGKK